MISGTGAGDPRLVAVAARGRPPVTPPAPIRALEAAMAPDQGSVTLWICALRAGDPHAARELWRRYFEALVRLARARLRARVVAEEDVALSAFDSFYAGVARGRFPDIADRDDLWRLLITMTTRKAANQHRRDSRQKRGGGRVVLESALAAGPESEADDLGQVIGPEPSPEFAAQVAEECGRRLGGLPDEALRTVATMKMEGYTNEEIADRLGCGERTITRKLAVIRKAWIAEEEAR
jgi:DNA-directed RNA polymerase specialized sigma24 family protein